MHTCIDNHIYLHIYIPNFTSYIVCCYASRDLITRSHPSLKPPTVVSRHLHFPLSLTATFHFVPQPSLYTHTLCFHYRDFILIVSYKNMTSLFIFNTCVCARLFIHIRKHKNTTKTHVITVLLCSFSPHLLTMWTPWFILLHNSILQHYVLLT